ncbi:MAG: response regulator [bacterium]|nr:response regulator [bacterium]
MIRVLIIEDEKPARERLIRLLSAYDDVEVVGEAADGREGISRIRELEPDAIFLDIKMPRLTGFEMLDKLPGSPYIIFITAYDEHALRAFEENTVDYLLKPVAEEKLERAIVKLRQILAGGAVATDLRRLRESMEGQERLLKRFSITVGREIVLVRADAVDYFHSEDKYTFLHIGEKDHIIPFTIKELAERLDTDTFLRVHRAYVVNLDNIDSVHRWFGGRMLIKTKSGHEVPVSRSFVAEFRKRINL